MMPRVESMSCAACPSGWTSSPKSTTCDDRASFGAQRIIVAIAGQDSTYNSNNAYDSLSSPSGVALDTTGNIYIADTNNHCIRKVSVADGTISTIAGTGSWGYSGDGGAATSARLSSPHGIALDTFGSIYISDDYNHRIRKLIESCNAGKIVSLSPFSFFECALL